MSHLQGGLFERRKLVLRVPIHMQSDSHQAITRVVEDEHNVLQELNKANFAWAPKLHGSSFTFENLIGFPFMALSWIEGSTLLWTMTDPPRPVRDKVLRQIAEIQMALIECTKEDRMSRYHASCANIH
jgi:aminoglycoside phosphotransferase (APT) family kinase protein